MLTSEQLLHVNKLTPRCNFYLNACARVGSLPILCDDVIIIIQVILLYGSKESTAFGVCLVCSMETAKLKTTHCTNRY